MMMFITMTKTAMVIIFLQAAGASALILLFWSFFFSLNEVWVCEDGFLLFVISESNFCTWPQLSSQNSRHLVAVKRKLLRWMTTPAPKMLDLLHIVGMLVITEPSHYIICEQTRKLTLFRNLLSSRAFLLPEQ